MVNINVGCAGWSYSDWKGTIYPKNMATTDYIKKYAHYFNFTEINSSFYNIPKKETIQHWFDKTPSNFRFSVKIWKEISHKFQYNDVEARVGSFFSQFGILDEKISTFLLQFPPRLKHTEQSLKKLKTLFNLFPDRYKYAVEFRDNSWFNNQEIEDIFHDSNFSPVTCYLDDMDVYSSPNQSFQYFRLIGDRALTKFNIKQREKKSEMDDLIQKVSKFAKSPDITDIFVIFNNHFRGFSPLDVNEFKKRLGLPYKNFSQQKTLFEF
jgi:uncharacterized protein YecE (DUF72 family)